MPLAGGGYGISQLDDYNYDGLNRIASVTEAQQNSSGTWTYNLFTQNFSYDRWGNRTVGCSPSAPGVTCDVFTVDAATNRLTAKNGFGMTYDMAGNQSYDVAGNRWYDGENRMKQAQQGGTTSYYVYDADGKRMRRIVGGTETWLVYGMDGELIAEYAANGAATSPQKEYGYRDGQMLIVAQSSPLEIRWLVTDHLGTPRINVRGTGTDGGSLASVTRHDYLPFGEELFVGLRSSGYGYEPPTDNVRQKFDAYERDNETGLDFAQARYFASVQGRFTSVDPLLSSGRTTNPQSWNRYTFALNNPLRLIDPSGMDPTEAQRRQAELDLEAAKKKIDQIAKSGGNLVIYVAGIDNDNQKASEGSRQAAAEMMRESGADNATVVSASNNHGIGEARKGQPNEGTALAFKNIVEYALKSGLTGDQISIIAHSNGVPSLAKGIESLQANDATKGIQFNSVTLVAPNTSDVNTLAAIGATSKLGGFSLYNSTKDVALNFSKGNSRSPQEWKTALRDVDVQVNVYRTGQITHSFRAYVNEIKKGKADLVLAK